MIETRSVYTRFHMSNKYPAVALHIGPGDGDLGSDFTVWMTHAELKRLRDQCQVADHILRERQE